MSGMPPVIVALSGGVDSAVAALRLKAAGHAVEGLHMTNWDDADPACTARDDLADARAIAAHLGIALHHVNFTAEYRAQVFAGFLAGYRDGVTPNPDVDCNRHIKFGECLAYAQRLGADWFATGHYARVDHGPPPRLLTAADQDKDQTYFLHAVEPAALAATLFPLGGPRKTEVRRMAADAGLPVHAKRDSAGICFIGRRPFRRFLGSHLPQESGEIVTADGRVLGSHAGLAYYTIGQRQGSGIGGQRDTGAAWYVAAKDRVRNRLVVVPGRDHPRLWTAEFSVAAVRWLRPPLAGEDLSVRTRHRQARIGCRIRSGAAGRIEVTAATPLFAITPGQYAVFYAGDECLGGGPVTGSATPDGELLPL